MLGLLWGLGVGQLPTRAAVEYTVIDLGAGADIRGVDASGVAFGAWHSKAAIFTPAPIPLGLLPEGDASCVPEDACGIWGPLPGQMPSRPRRASPRTMSSGGGRMHARRVNPSSSRCGAAARSSCRPSAVLRAIRMPREVESLSGRARPPHGTCTRPSGFWAWLLT